MQINIYAVLLAFSFIASALLTFYISKIKKDKVKKELFFLLLFISIWILAYAIEAFLTSLDSKIIFSKFSYIGIVAAPMFFFFFILRYSSLDSWLTNKNKLFFFIIPIITLMLVATNQLHGLVWQDIHLKQNNFAGIFAFYERGAWFWVNLVYSYMFLTVGFFLLIFTIFRYKKFYSLQSRIIIIGSFFPLFGNALYTFSQNSLEGVDITPIMFTITGFFLVLGIVRYKCLDITPINNDTITENLYDGILLLNKDNIILDINKAATQLLSIDNSAIGKPLESLLKGNKNILKYIKISEKEGKIVRELKLEGKEVFLELRIKLLTDSYESKAGVIIVIRDITAKKEGEKKLRESQNLFFNIIDFLPDATFAIDTGGKVIAWNKIMEKLTGIKKEDILGKGNYAYALPFYGKRKPALLDLIINSDLEIKDDYGFIKREGNSLAAEIDLEISGKYSHFWLTASPLLNGENKIIGAIESIRDITRIKETENELRYISFHDSLTGLYNRAYFEEELKRLNKSRQLPLSIIIADINKLKLVNDAFGHQFGDKLLKSSARLIKKSCRSEDIIARWGGDEFIILLPETNKKEVKEVKERILLNSKQENFIIPIIFSIGVATKVKLNTRSDIIIRKAENDMYKNKLLKSRDVEDSVIEFIVETLYKKNIENKEEVERIIRLSTKLARKIGLPESKLEDLVLFSKLHDIGKIAVKEEILKKKTKLDKAEWDEIKKHSEIGYRIAKVSSRISHIADYILCMHENWDGTGYPRGIKGEKIPLIVRILAVVDAYVAMTSKKPYRKKFTKGKALDELKNASGTQYDPKIVDEFIEIF